MLTAKEVDSVVLSSPDIPRFLPQAVFDEACESARKNIHEVIDGT